jgi:hypothetical protein
MNQNQILANIQKLSLADKMNLLELLVKDIRESVLPNPTPPSSNKTTEQRTPTQSTISSDDMDWFAEEFKKNPDMQPTKKANGDDFIDFSEHLL